MGVGMFALVWCKGRGVLRRGGRKTTLANDVRHRKGLMWKARRSQTQEEKGPYKSPEQGRNEEKSGPRVYQFSGVKMELPENVHLLTLEPWKDGKILLRFEHIMEKSDDLRLSRASEFSIQDLFEAKVQKVTEMTLGANQILSSSRRFKWNEDKFTSGTKNDQDRTAPERNVIQSSDYFKVILYPMQIRTFVVEF
ncbi:Hypothetical predicted protein [Cloeon dipterum]|uniref:Glycosyl hydrolases family 38 C-terminal domain-containing protein n=1 Tax=Cloeon dipterum TaxID=197152 RepID=A0A8S1E7F9_9INSE|nr:Hypothetical predicted protein [Cloeon dipterum]